MLNSSINKRRSLAPLLFLCLSLAGCAIGPFEEPPEADPLPEGPGLFTGKTGYYSPNEDSKNAEVKPGSSEDTALESTGDFAEFEAYQRWKTEERDSNEYREFLQWQQYRKWKSQQDK
jgi:hypothetical protein